MSGRYTQLGRRDKQDLAEGDGSFVGVDMRRDPSQLEAGVASGAINYEFLQGVATPRNGMQTRTWAAEGGASFPWNFPVSFLEGVGFGTIFGAAGFSDPYGNESIILACANRSYQIAAGAPINVIDYPTGVVIDDEVNFTQAFNVLLMWRGETLAPLKLETALNFSLPQVWAVVPDETDMDYTSTIPHARRGLHYGNRVWVGYRGSKIAYSDILAYTRYDAVLSTLYVNEGDSDILQVLFPFGNNAIAAFKNRSIYAIMDVLPAPGLTSRVENVTRQRGTLAPDSVTQCGNDIWFLSDDGIYTISQTLDNNLQASAEPVSAPMDPLFQRVTWAAANKAQGLYLAGRFYLAMPIDGSTWNNCIVVFDFLTGRWAGYWTGPWLDVLRLLRVTVSGKSRMMIVSGNHLTSTNNGVLFLLGDGFEDERFGTSLPVLTELLTRGYTGGLTDTKEYIAAECELATWYGAAEISNVRDGVNEEGDLLGIIKDRRKYYIWAMPDYDTSNANQDHGEPYREDYSVELQAGGIDFSSGIALGLHQFSSERMRIRQHGRHLQVKINGTRGRVKVRTVVVHAKANAEAHRVKV